MTRPVHVPISARCRQYRFLSAPGFRTARCRGPITCTCGYGAICTVCPTSSIFLQAYGQDHRVLLRATRQTERAVISIMQRGRKSEQEIISGIVTKTWSARWPIAWYDRSRQPMEAYLDPVPSRLVRMARRFVGLVGVPHLGSLARSVWADLPWAFRQYLSSSDRAPPAIRSSYVRPP
jgi:hypothetical protein